MNKSTLLLAASLLPLLSACNMLTPRQRMRPRLSS